MTRNPESIYECTEDTRLGETEYHTLSAPGARTHITQGTTVKLFTHLATKDVGALSLPTSNEE